MKIFNFSQGVKGELLEDTAYSQAMVVSTTHTLKDSDFVLCDRIERSFGKIRSWYSIPQKADAICFCVGKDANGKWIWGVVGRPEWISKMIESGKIIEKE